MITTLPTAASPSMMSAPAKETGTIAPSPPTISILRSSIRPPPARICFMIMLAVPSG